MKVCIIQSKGKEVLKVLTLHKFIDMCNEEYYEANNFCVSPEYFSINSIEFALNYYNTSSDNTICTIKTLETSISDDMYLQSMNNMCYNIIVEG